MSILPDLQSLSLQKRLLLILILAAICFILVQLLITKFFVYPSYVHLERKKGTTDIERCVNALASEIHHLSQYTHDWASWDDTYSFINDRNEEYIVSNLQMSTFVGNEVTLIFYISREREVIWGKIVDLENGDIIESTDFPQKRWPVDHQLLTNNTQNVKGLFMSDLGPLLISSCPILRTDNSGPGMGTLVMGRLLSDELINRLQQQTQVRWTISPVSKIDQKLTLAETDLLKGQEKVNFQEQGESLIVSTLYNDLGGKPGLLLRAEVKREITHQGSKTLIFVFWYSLIGILLIFKLLLLLLNRLIVEPVSALTNDVVQIHDTGKLTLLAKSRRDDDIGILTREINRLIDKLFSYQYQLRALSSQLLVTEETERRQFARDLHDRISQSLAMIKMRIDRMAACSTDKSHCTEARALSNLLGTLIEEARTLTFELSPPMLYEIGLCAALEWLAEIFQKQYSLQVHFSCQEGLKEKNSTFDAMVFQIIRELLTNVVKHAKVDEAILELSIEGDEFVTTLSDKGVGFGANFNVGLTADKDGYGLFSIRERLNNLGGRFEINSQTGRGTTIIFGIPFDKINPEKNSGKNAP